MHRRFLKSLATVMGAAALVVAPMALLAPSAQAAIVLDESNADDIVPFIANEPGVPGTNQVAYWVNYLEEKGFTDVYCEKVTPKEDTKTWVIPAPPEGDEYVLVTSKAGSGDKANLVWWAPKAAEGNTVTAVDGKDISHLVWCTGEQPVTTTPPPSTTPPASTPPVVDTDRVSTGSGANLGLYGAAAALLVGAGAIVAGRRRQGAHR